METDLNEILRYMEVSDPNLAEDSLLQLARQARDTIAQIALPRSVSKVLPVTFSEESIVTVGSLSIKSQDLRKTIAGCDTAVLFAATLGLEIDYAIGRYSHTDMTFALALQAGAAAYLEGFCDEWQQEQVPPGRYLRPRFSPGYGDFSITWQKKILELLRASETIGIKLTEHLMMLPSKSITAVIGFGKEELPCPKQKCDACGNQNCPYRRGDAHGDTA